MFLYDSPAVQHGLARRSLEEDSALRRRQGVDIEQGTFETLVYTTTIAFEVAVPTSTPIPGSPGSFSSIDVVESVTEVITSSILISPVTSALPAAQASSSSLAVSSVSSSSAVATSSTTSSALTLPSSSSTLSPSPSPSPTQSTSSPASQSDNSNAAAAAQSSAAASATPTPHTISAGAIAGIVVAIVVFLNIVGILLYRRRQMARRQLRRATWKAAIRAKPSDFTNNLEKGVEPMPVLTPFTLGLPGSGNRASRASRASRVSSGTRESRRHSIFNLPSALASTPEAAFPRDHFNPARAASPSLRESGAGNLPVRPARSDQRTARKSPPAIDDVPVSATAGDARVTPAAAHLPTALVRVTFIPTRSDELSISIGQTLALLHRFDDGWALCANAYGEQGMVPLECLEGGGGQFAGFKDRSAMMKGSSKRASSLYPPTGTSSRFANMR